MVSVFRIEQACAEAPKIVACFLITIEEWLYTRPDRVKLEHSISLIFNRTSSVAMLGVLVSLAKCDPSLLSSLLLPLISSLQLLVWLEFEQIDHGQNFGFDSTSAWSHLLEEERQELLAFNQLSYRTDDLQRIILHLWINEVIPSRVRSQILEDWDNYQLAVTPDINRHRALRIRAWFERSNWQKDKDNEENQIFRFISTLPEEPEVEAKAETAQWNLQHLQITVTCQRILDRESQKTLDLHRQLVTLLTSEEQINYLKERLEPQAFRNVAWAAIAVVLEPPPDTLEQELETKLNYLADGLSNFPIDLNHSNRCRYYDLDAEAFIAHAAPKLIRKLESKSSLRAAAFHCLIGVRNRSTSAFMHSWIREYGLADPLTQELINITPQIARLISLTYVLSYTDAIQQATNERQNAQIIPHTDDIHRAVSNQEHPKIEVAWSILERDFVERKLPELSMIEVFEWTPEILVQPLQQQPPWLRSGFDWDFLAAVLIPALEAQPDGKIAHKLVDSLREQLLFALLHERKFVYENYQAEREEDGYSSVDTQLYQAQSQMLDAVVKSSPTDISARINVLLHVLKTAGFVDCIVLESVVDLLSDYTVKGDSSDVTNNSFRNYTACAIGQYIFDLQNQQESDLPALGEIENVWEKLIKLLSGESQENENLENGTLADQWLVQFFKRFQDVLLPNWWLRRKLYRVGSSTRFRRFRRVLFTTLVQHQELLPTSQNDESELLVQVFAELWESDRIWIIDRPSQRNGLRILLGQLQNIDAVGARRLADQIADSLAHPSD